MNHREHLACVLYGAAFRVIILHSVLIIPLVPVAHRSTQPASILSQLQLCKPPGVHVLFSYRGISVVSGWYYAHVVAVFFHNALDVISVDIFS